MEVGRSLNLARLTAEMLMSFALSLAVLKVIDFGAATRMSVRRVMHFKVMFEELMAAEERILWNVFTRVAGSVELEELRNGVEFFVSHHVIGSSSSADLQEKLDNVRKAMRNVEGVLH